MADPFVGEIKMFGFNYAPKNWAHCNGQTMPISQNTALFSLLVTTYGGDGKTTFKLPDLQGRVPINSGQGSGLSPYRQGETGGVTAVRLDPNNMPAHTHPLMVFKTAAATSFPEGGTFAIPGSTVGNSYSGAGDGSGPMGALPIEGGSLPHSNEQPYLALNFCIALTGIFPQRP